MKKSLRNGHESSTRTGAKASTRKPASFESKKITIDVPQSLLDAAAQVAPERHLTKSALVREAIKYYIEDKQARSAVGHGAQSVEERLLEEGYLATADLSEQVHCEFGHVDSENG